VKRLSQIATMTAFVALGTLSFAQVPGPQHRPPAQQTDPADPQTPGDNQQLTLTGCLMKGASANEYAITDSRSGEKYSFGAPDQLQKYLNQTVQLTGTVTMRGGEKSFRPETVKSLSSSCESK
jgi:hypothetical protein